MKAWIVLPAYNEELGLPPLIDSICEALGEDRRDFSILVVDDGSKDGTWAVLQKYAKSSPVIPIQNPVNMGLAETLKAGLLEAAERAGDKDVIITMDADNTHPAGLILRMIRSIREGSDVVIASRYRPGSRVIGLVWYRGLLSFLARIVFSAVYPTPGVRDFTCGYRAYRAEMIRELIRKYRKDFISERGFSCMVDILLKLRGLNPVFVEVPLILRYDQKEGASKMKIFSTIVDTLKLIVRRRFADLIKNA